MDLRTNQIDHMFNLILFLLHPNIDLTDIEVSSTSKTASIEDELQDQIPFTQLLHQMVMEFTHPYVRTL